VRAHESRREGAFYGGGRICLRRRRILGGRAHQAKWELILWWVLSSREEAHFMRG
jgi:hypothetical protein